MTPETVPMDAETMAALKGSIAKWEAIVAGAGKDFGASNCPLCRKFLIAYTALSEIDDGDAIEAAIRYLISRFAVQMRFQIRQGGRYGCTHCD